MYENEDGWSDWINPIKGYKMACCDCKLVHVLEFKVLDPEGQSPSQPIDLDGSTIEADLLFRAKRDNRSTGQMRRYNKKNS